MNAENIQELVDSLDRVLTNTQEDEAVLALAVVILLKYNGELEAAVCFVSRILHHIAHIELRGVASSGEIRQ